MPCYIKSFNTAFPPCTPTGPPSGTATTSASDPGRSLWNQHRFRLDKEQRQPPFDRSLH